MARRLLIEVSRSFTAPESRWMLRHLERPALRAIFTKRATASHRMPATTTAAIGDRRALPFVAQRRGQPPGRRVDDVRPARPHDRVDQADAHLRRHARD